MAAPSRKLFVPPSMNDDFEAWLREIEIWRCVTDLDKKKQGPAIYLSLDLKTRNACADIDVKDLNGDDGVDVLLAKLRTLYAKDVNQVAFSAYETFEKFSRPKTMSVGDYINEFERLYYKIKSCKMELPDGVLAYRVLKSSNISKEKEQLARATISELTYDNMKRQLKSIFDYCSESSEVMNVKDEIKVEEEILFTRNSAIGTNSRASWRNRQRGFRPFNHRGATVSTYASRGGRKTNPLDNYGNPSTCAICNSIFHWARDCPDSHEMRRSVEKITLFTQEIQDCYISRFLGETLNYGILDSGCTQNVCGRVWLECYLSTLNHVDDFQERMSDVHFRFGTGPPLKSIKNVTFPVYVAEKPLNITCEVVDCDLPLLLSKDWMKSTGTKIDFVNDSANILGIDLNLNYTESGHYAIPLGKQKTVFLSESVISEKSKEEKQHLVTKLHKQFAHPSGDKLVRLVKESGVNDKELFDLIRNHENICEICVRYRKPAHRPVVGLSLTKEFNDTVSMDLKFVNGQQFLHLIDHATRYSAGSLLDSKEKEEIVDKIFKHWIALFGIPNKLLSDNGGEFNNELFRDMAENLNIRVLTTAAEAPWSNGITERHNAIIANMMTKIVQDTKCSPTVALAWALSAKNSLQNVYGYSPNQLVFGRNPNTPCVLTDDLPALEGKTTSELIAEHLNALHAARKSFVQSEASEKLRRALRHQIRPSTNLVFEQGDEVFYKRNDGAKWKGPGTVIGKDNQQVFVRHGGTYVRVHPCRLQHKNHAEVPLKESVTPTTSQSSVIEPVYDNTILNLYDSEPDSTNNQSDGYEITETDTTLVSGESNKTLPARGSKILFRETSDSDWSEAVIIGRAGKATGKNKQWVNIKDTADGTLKSLNLENLDWKITEDILISSVSSKSQNESISVIEAKMKELDNWKEHGVYTEVEDQGQLCVSVRWVITEKVKDGQTVVKARLVARGFEEQSLNELRKDSPTCCKENLRLVLVIISTFGWKLNSLDVKSAFLQGKDIERDVFLCPPREAGTTKLWKLKTTVYGLCDAPRVWYLRIKEELLQCGAILNIYDEAVFFWHSDNRLQGIICCHVDDFCWGGTELFQAKVINVIRSKFLISTEDQEIFRYVGLELKQTNDEIQISQQEYIDEISFLDISLNGRSKSDSITESELKLLRGIAGQLNWTASQTRPDIAYYACETSVAQKNGTVEDLIKINKSIRKLKNEKVYLRFPCLGDIDRLCLLAFSDASLANLKNSGSQGGYVIFLHGANGKSALLSWQSKKIRRVVKSTIAAEALALLESAEACCLLRTTLCNILNINVNKVPIHCIVDNKSLCETVVSTKTLIDKRLKIDVCVLRDMLSRGEIQNVDWTDTAHQLADSLTKAGAASNYLISALSGQHLSCKYCGK